MAERGAELAPLSKKHPKQRSLGVIMGRQLHQRQLDNKQHAPEANRFTCEQTETRYVGNTAAKQGHFLKNFFGKCM